MLDSIISAIERAVLPNKGKSRWSDEEIGAVEKLADKARKSTGDAAKAVAGIEKNKDAYAEFARRAREAKWHP